LCYYEHICLADKSGDLLASADETLIGKISVKNRSFFPVSMQGKQYISEVTKSQATGNPVLMISAPVKEKDEVTGVLFAVLDLNTFAAKFVDNIKVGEWAMLTLPGRRPHISPP